MSVNIPRRSNALIVSNLGGNFNNQASGMNAHTGDNTGA
jgi:hypothetical protein